MLFREIHYLYQGVGLQVDFYIINYKCIIHRRMQEWYCVCCPHIWKYAWIHVCFLRARQKTAWSFIYKKGLLSLWHKGIKYRYLGLTVLKSKWSLLVNLSLLLSSVSERTHLQSWDLNQRSQLPSPFYFLDTSPRGRRRLEWGPFIACAGPLMPGRLAGWFLFVPGFSSIHFQMGSLCQLSNYLSCQILWLCSE